MPDDRNNLRGRRYIEHPDELIIGGALDDITPREDDATLAWELDPATGAVVFLNDPERRWAAVPPEEAHARRRARRRLAIYAVAWVVAILIVVGLILATATPAEAGTFERSIEWTLGRHVGNMIWGAGPYAVIAALALLFALRRRRR